MKEIENALNRIEETMNGASVLLDEMSTEIAKIDHRLNNSKFTNIEFKFEFLDERDSIHYFMWKKQDSKGKFKYRLFYECLNLQTDYIEISKAFSETPAQIRLNYYGYLPHFLQAFEIVLAKQIETITGNSNGK